MSMNHTTPSQTPDIRSLLANESARVLVIGLAQAGLAAAEVLRRRGATLYGLDKKAIARPDLFAAVADDMEAAVMLDERGAPLDFDYAVISPGVPLESDFARACLERGIPLIGEIELAYHLTDCRFISITGTNGKTTTTSLVGEIMRRVDPSSRVCGNIGIPAPTVAAEARGTTLVAELSSFQLETLYDFRSSIGAILNITPDHLDRHKTMDRYVECKRSLGLRSDVVVVNADDPLLDAMVWPEDTRVYRFSRLRDVDGASVRGGAIHCLGERICTLEEIPLVGAHNVENVLAAALICRLAGVPAREIRDGIMAFRAVEHRIEYVRTIALPDCGAAGGGASRSLDCYNDSKATNPDSAIKAIASFDVPIHLIAGGFERGADFVPMLQEGRGKIASLSLLGATAERLRDAAVSVGYEHIRLCPDMASAVRSAYAFACETALPQPERSVLLLSPACASWGMYENYMKRGEEFKQLVQAL